jgi:16S rRNA (cytosine967-C5)-methyltransferase
MDITANQQRTFLRLLKQLRPRWHTDHGLPGTIQSLLARERAFGSRDRRLYRELIYTTLRYLPWIESFLDREPDEAVRRVAWLAAETPATAAFRTAFASGQPPTGDKTELLPAWFHEHCPEIFSGAELDAQLRRAPVWLRLQTDAAAESRVWEEFTTRGWKFRRSLVLPSAIELLTETDVTQSDAWRAGSLEVQDLGSQLLLEMVGVERDGRWLDACAGAGGKTLQLARMLGGSGTVDAHDIRPAALQELKTRVARAQIRNVHTTSSPALGDYDGVLVDAPCSGSGTWRRAPHLKWTTSPAVVAQRATLQKHLLSQFARCVRPGGRLIYATCSLSSQENEAVVAAFLAEHPEFETAPFANLFSTLNRRAGQLILPSVHDTDGFFVASLRRK